MRVEGRGIQSMLSETGVSQMPVITHFISKNRTRDFLQYFYICIVFFNNNYKQNLIHPLWIGYNVPLSLFWWKFNTNLTILAVLWGLKEIGVTWLPEI